MGSPCFNDLQYGPKFKIFEYLTTENRQQVRSVCSEWRNIINKNFGLSIRIRNDTSDLVMTCKNAVEVELRNMTVGFPKGSIIFSNYLRTLQFSEISVTYNVVRFLRECHKIKSLSFSNVVIDIPMNGPWSPPEHKENLILENLETLNIEIPNFTDSTLEILQFLKDRVQYGALKVISVAITHFAVDLPLHMMFADREQENNHVLLKLVTKNLNTLLKFVFTRPRSENILQFHPFGVFGNDNPVQLRDLTITSNSYLPEQWILFFQNQTHLKTVDLRSVSALAWSEVYQGITQNTSTLTDFKISSSTFAPVWDCVTFRNCVSLQSISLKIRNASKVNLRSLPTQLKHLSICGPIAHNELLSVRRLVNLTSLKIEHLKNHSDSDKVHLETFQSLLQLPMLKTLSIESCSSSCVDWSAINAWCDVNKEHGLAFEKLYFPSISEPVIQDGITVTIFPSFEKDPLDLQTAEDIGTSILNSIITHILHLIVH